MNSTQEQLPSLTQRAKIRRRKRRMQGIIYLAAFLLAIALVITGVVFAVKGVVSLFQKEPPPQAPEKDIVTINRIIAEADFLAAGYDYDAAIEKIKTFGDTYLEHEEFTSAIARYEETKATMLLYPDVREITHVFFHSLIVDTARAFDGESTETGYNQNMTTVSEFRKMLEQMHVKGYVLVSMYDIATEQTNEDGSTKFVPSEIWLPEGKKPFVMSQDDVNYYNYMKTDGFARKIVIGEDGYPTCEYVQTDGTVVLGEYDLVPILESFIREHPDFSYRGARALLALTGYEGVLGYRTCPSDDNYNENDIEPAKKVVAAMKEKGWDFASHSWGHLPHGSISADRLRTDAGKWNDQVKPILGEVDIFVYPYGEDIAGVEDYSGEKYQILKDFGFKYFCNVDSNKYWVQIRDGYVRQGRRNLDGYRMYYNPERLEDLFSTQEVWDEGRPTPVPSMNAGQ